MKLFICSNANKQYRADAQIVFSQADLTHTNQAILDRHSEVIVWVGKDTKAEDRVLIQEIAVDYVGKADDGRGDCPVWVMDEGEENVDFTRYFLAWDPERMQSKKKHIAVGTPLQRSKSKLPKAALGAQSSGAKYPLAKLVDRDYLPEGVDKRKLEEYLRDEDFPEVFGMSAADFNKVPSVGRALFARARSLSLSRHSSCRLGSASRQRRKVCFFEYVFTWIPCAAGPALRPCERGACAPSPLRCRAGAAWRQCPFRWQSRQMSPAPRPHAWLCTRAD